MSKIDFAMLQDDISDNSNNKAQSKKGDLLICPKLSSG
jgi:hypothetical protein